MTYYIKGGSKFNEANPKVWVNLFLGGYNESFYLDTNWKNIADKGVETNGDPYWRLGGLAGGEERAEFGLRNKSRVMCGDEGGVESIWGWDIIGGNWVNLMDAALNVCNNVFKTVNCPDGTDPVALGCNDILNLTATGDVVITGNAGTDTVDFSITKYTDAEVDARIVVQNTHPAGTIDIAIDALILAHKNIVDAHHVKYTNAEAIAAVLGDDKYIKNYEADATTGDLTVPNLICAGLVDGIDVSAIRSFKTITGITNNVIADNVADTLTLVSVGGLTIVGTAATDTITFTNTITQYTDAMVDARIIVQNTHPAGTIDIAIDALIATHTGLPNAHHVAFVQGDADALYSVLAHLHDDRYYTEGEIDANTYTRAQVDAFKLNKWVAPDGSVAMGAQKITGLGNGVVGTDAMAFGQKYTNANAVSAVLADDKYVKNYEADATTGDLTVPNLICAGLVDGKDVSGLCTTAEAHAYVEANALTLTANVIFNAGQLFDGKDVSGLCTVAEALTHVQDTGITLVATKVYNSADEDTEHLFGRTRIGDASYADYASLAHRDMTGVGQYALMQSSTGETYVNGADGKFIAFRVNNATKGTFTSAGFIVGADARITEFDTDVNLAGGNTKVPTDLAVKTYADTKCTTAEAHAYVEANALTLTANVIFNAGQLFDGKDVSGLCTVAEAQAQVEANTKIDNLQTGDDNADLNATITEHGLLKKLDNTATNFMNGTGNWSVPAGIGGGSDKGELQGHIVPIAGCVWGSTYINMTDSGDSAQCIFHLSDNISASHDITVVMVYAPRVDYTTPTMNLYMALTKTDDSEVLSWNYKNAEATSMTKCIGADWELKRKEWVIPHASFDQNDLLSIYWANTNNYDYRVHGIILEYTEA